MAHSCMLRQHSYRPPAPLHPHPLLRPSFTSWHARSTPQELGVAATQSGRSVHPQSSTAHDRPPLVLQDTYPDVISIVTFNVGKGIKRAVTNDDLHKQLYRLADIVVFTEVGIGRSDEAPSMKGFVSVAHALRRKQRGGLHQGGVSVYVREALFIHPKVSVRLLDKDYMRGMVILQLGFPSYRSLLLAGLYVPHATSEPCGVPSRAAPKLEYYTDLYGHLTSRLVDHSCSNTDWIVTGDLNAHINPGSEEAQNAPGVALLAFRVQQGLEILNNSMPGNGYLPQPTHRSNASKKSKDTKESNGSKGEKKDTRKALDFTLGKRELYRKEPPSSAFRIGCEFEVHGEFMSPSFKFDHAPIRVTLAWRRLASSEADMGLYM